MNELFNFHRELNVKKIIIVLLIAIAIPTAITLTLRFSNNYKETKIENSKPNTIFTSDDNSISIELSKKYGLSKYTPVQNYVLELRSPKNIDIFISHENLLENKSLSDIATSDRMSYIENFKSYSNLSDIAPLTIDGNNAYTYSFHYLDNKDNRTPYYLQIIWVETENGYYIIDIEFPLEALDENSSILTDIINKLKINLDNNM